MALARCSQNFKSIDLTKTVLCLCSIVIFHIKNRKIPFNHIEFYAHNYAILSIYCLGQKINLLRTRIYHKDCPKKEYFFKEICFTRNICKYKTCSKILGFWFQKMLLGFLRAEKRTYNIIMCMYNRNIN